MKTIKAIYREGGFFPEESVSLEPGTRVEVSIPEPNDLPSGRDRFRGMIGGISAADLDQMKVDIAEAFEQVGLVTQ